MVYAEAENTERAEGDRVHRFRHSPTGGRNLAAAPGDEAFAPPSRKRGINFPIRGRPRLPGMTSLIGTFARALEVLGPNSLVFAALAGPPARPVVAAMGSGL
jgi:hypothetical protein